MNGMQIATGLRKGMLLRTVPIKTVGLCPLAKYCAWLFKQRQMVVEEPFQVPRPTGGFYIIPKGFVFDGGSIPRWLLVLVVALYLVEPISMWLYSFPYALGKLPLLLVFVGLLIERFGLMLSAFAVHDFAVKYGLLIMQHGGIEKIMGVRHANNVMRRVNFATNDMVLLGLVAHMAVSAGAWVAWNKHRKGLTVPNDEWKKLDYGRKLSSIYTKGDI
jgi:hypothetical protein